MATNLKSLSAEEQQTADYISERTATIVVDRLQDVLLDEDFADKFFGVWGGKIDRTIGRGLRRLGFYVLIIMVGLAAVKFGLVHKFISIFDLKP